MSKFMIRFAEGMYSLELYCSRGAYIYDLMVAIQEAEIQFPDEEYELYNGNEGYRNYKEF